MSYKKQPANPWLLLIIFFLISVLITWFAAADYLKYDRLSKNGKGARALIVSYVPEVSHGRHGDTTYHYHMVNVDGKMVKIKLDSERSPGQIIDVVFLAETPDKLTEGKPGMTARQLMGSDFMIMLIMTVIFDLIFVLLLIFNNPMDEKVKQRMAKQKADSALDEQPDAIKALLRSGKLTAKINTPRPETQTNLPPTGPIPVPSMTEVLNTEATAAAKDYMRSIKTREEVIACLKAKCPGFTELEYEEALNRNL